MKKVVKFALAALAVLSLGVACSKEAVAPESVSGQENVTPAEGQPITICASLADLATKVSFTPDVNTDGKPIMKLAWSAGDKLLVADHADPDNKSYLDLKDESIGQKEGVFTGTLSFTAESYDVSVVHAEVDLANQTQAADGDFSGIQFIASVAGVTDIATISFDSVSSILALRAKLPSVIASDVKTVTLKSTANIFAGGNTMKVTLANKGVTSGDDVLDVFATLAAGEDVAIPSETVLIVQFDTEDGSKSITRYHKFTADAAFKSNAYNSLAIKCVDITNSANDLVISGNGSSESMSYLIGDKYQMDALRHLMVSGVTTYVKLVEDIDLSGIAWVSLNYADPYNKYIHFDGGNHVISNLTSDSGSYPSFIGVVYGTVKDVTFDHATIASSSTVNQHVGVLGGYLGANNQLTSCEVSNVTIKNSSVSTEGSSRRAGGLAAMVAVAATISNVNIESSTVTAQYYHTGGLFGEIDKAATISGCHVKGTTVTISNLSKNDVYVGGLVGFVNAAASFTDCHVEKDASDAISSVHAPAYTEANGKFVYLGGMFGGIPDAAATIDDCHASHVKVALAADGPVNNNLRYSGGAFGYIGTSAVVGNTTGCTVDTPSFDNLVNYSGAFVGTLAGGTVKQSSVIGGSIKGAATVGGFAGFVTSGILDGCSSSCETEATSNIGGLIGQMQGGTVSNCHTSGKVTATGNNAGGIVGPLSGGSLTKCYATGNVNGNSYVGGIAGHVTVAASQTIEISKCYYSTGTVNGSYRQVGGLVGLNDGEGTLDINNCYVTGNVKATNGWAGGLLGVHSKGKVNLTNCYATAEVSAPWGVGGIVGQVAAAGLSVTRCMPFNAKISATNTDSAAHYSSGAVIAYGKSVAVVVAACYRWKDLGSVFNDCSSNSANVMENHSFITTAANIPQRKSLQYGYYHHGRNTNMSLCELVNSGAIGEDWSSDIWDFSGELPTLK